LVVNKVTSFKSLRKFLLEQAIGKGFVAKERKNIWL
jgi:hypothetical protein